MNLEIPQHPLNNTHKYFPIQKDDISHHFTGSSSVILHFTNKLRPLKTITKITNPTIQ